MAFVVVNLPPLRNEFMDVYQKQIEGVFGNTWRIVAGSMIAFACGSFVNSFVLAKMKILTQGRYLWARTIGSTVVGQLVDTGLFFFIAFWGIWPQEQLYAVIVAQYLFKTAWEALMTPITYRVVGFLKRVEGVDYYDTHTNFTPFSLKV
jgi:uncharacterized integral membrane protein (TIGR00697 family)